jgi:subtilisin family serine protease
MVKKILFFGVGLILLTLVGCVKKEIPVQTPDEVLTLKSANIQKGYATVPNEVLIKFREGVDENGKTLVLGKFGGKHKEKILTSMMEKRGDKQGIAVVSMPGTVDDAIARMKGLPEVEYAEPNYIYTHEAVSNDPYYTTSSRLWGMYGDGTSPANQYGSQAGEAWAAGHTGTATVYVGIIDEGYMYTHEDLAANAGKNPYEISGNGIDDDGNGYKDDVYGWDFDGNNNTVFDGIADDHGTHVAGTIGAVGGNGKGVAGICWNVRLLDAKFLGATGGTTANAILAVDYFTNLKSKGLNIVATNNSWGGGGFSQLLKDAIDRAGAQNILFIAAAGNNATDNDVTPSYPASYTSSNIIAVAAITSTGTLASFSQYGATSVDIGAPGQAIYSSVPVKSGKKVVSGYASYNGTSMATPHVTGACALYASTHPGSTPAQIKAAILGSAVPTASLAGKCVTGGRLNVSGF